LRLLGAIVAFTRNALALALIVVEALTVPEEGLESRTFLCHILVRLVDV
jgi:hypothetical protein